MGSGCGSVAGSDNQINRKATQQQGSVIGRDVSEKSLPNMIKMSVWGTLGESSFYDSSIPVFKATSTLFCDAHKMV